MNSKPTMPPLMMTFEHLFANIIDRYTVDTFWELRVPAYYSVGLNFGSPPPTIKVEAAHLCRIDNEGIHPFDKGEGTPHLSEEGWNAHKHLLQAKIKPKDFRYLEKLCAVEFAYRREDATKRHAKLRQRIAEMEAYFPHLRSQS